MLSFFALSLYLKPPALTVYFLALRFKNYVIAVFTYYIRQYRIFTLTDKIEAACSKFRRHIQPELSCLRLSMQGQYNILSKSSFICKYQLIFTQLLNTTKELLENYVLPPLAQIVHKMVRISKKNY